MRANSKLPLSGTALIILFCFGARSFAQPSPNRISCTTQTMSMLADRINACTLIIESGSSSPEALADAYGNRGVAFFNTYLNDHKEDDKNRAIGDLEKSLSLDATSASGHKFHGNLYFATGDDEAAITELSEAIRLDGTQAIFFQARGAVYFRKQDYERAIADFNEALRMDSKFVLALYSRGAAYHRIRKLDLAIQDLSEAIGLDPSVADGFRRRANAYFDKRDFDRAIADYTEAIRLGDSHADVYKFRGESFAAKRTMFTHCPTLTPRSSSARKMLTPTAAAAAFFSRWASRENVSAHGGQTVGGTSPINGTPASD
jgi:tetratricopeptide (TPR) repeat protein